MKNSKRQKKKRKRKKRKKRLMRTLSKKFFQKATKTRKYSRKITVFIKTNAGYLTLKYEAT